MGIGCPYDLTRLQGSKGLCSVGIRCCLRLPLRGFFGCKVWDLIPGGRDVAVTNSSVISYIHLMAHFKLNVQTARPCMAFLRGFR